MGAAGDMLTAALLELFDNREEILNELNSLGIPGVEYKAETSEKCGIAGNLLNMAVEDLRSKGISPVYLVSDHTGFYERYGWEFLCMVHGDGEPDMTRMYIHR